MPRFPFGLTLLTIAAVCLPESGGAFSVHGPTTSARADHPAPPAQCSSESRRSLLASAFSGSLAAAAALVVGPREASAEVDCMKDCLKSCNLIAPKVRHPFGESVEVLRCCRR
mmetsp:Transcript_46834/g.141872  ORF Transcript_46834/g.141872 Transcript_46834/m.141872 type:complete len:113 (-) Transcript_46834:628-966(-)